MEIKIRKATTGDVLWVKKHLTEMWVTHAKHEPSLLSERLMKTTFDHKKYNAWTKNKNTTALIAEINGEIAGFLKADIQRIPSFFKNNKILYVDSVYVAKKYRRHGVARKLLHEAEKFARKRGIKRLQGRVYKFNKPSQKLLESTGWRTPHMTYDKVLK